MPENKFINNDFFELSGLFFKDLLENKSPWGSVANLKAYIEGLFASGRFSANFSDRKNVYVGKGTLVHPSVEITGPAIIGEGCEIRHGAFLRENCLIANNVIVGHAVEVKNSIILNNASIAHLNYVGDSIIGNYSNVAGGAILANYRLDKKNILIKFNDQAIDTKLIKFGAVVGDHSTIGVNSVLNPGTIIGKNSVVYPLKAVVGVYEEGSKIR